MCRFKVVVATVNVRLLIRLRRALVSRLSERKQNRMAWGALSKSYLEYQMSFSSRRLPLDEAFPSSGLAAGVGEPAEEAVGLTQMAEERAPGQPEHPVRAELQLFQLHPQVPATSLAPRSSRT